MRKLIIGASLLAIAAVLLWIGRTAGSDFLSTGQSQEGPRAAWISKQWSAKVTVDALTLDTEQLELSLAEQKKLTAHKSQAFRREGDTMVWYGSLSEAGQTAPATGTLEAAMNGIVLVISNGRASGTLRWNGQYRLLPANDGYVLEEVDGAKLPPDHAPDDAPMAPASQPISKPLPHDPNHATVRVLIVGSKNAADAHEDLPALARLAIEESNQTYLNSGINMSLELADFRQLDYEQHSSSVDIDLRRLVAPADGFMDEVHQMRDQLKADVVVLVVDTIREACGRASSRPATAETAFAYVNLKCIGVWRFTTGHEIAHLQGASHEYVEGSNDPFGYGHGYIHEPEGEHGWRTVMATVTGANDTRVPFWSDPERLMDGVPMGDTDTADNRRVLEETKWTIAGFR